MSDAQAPLPGTPGVPDAPEGVTLRALAAGLAPRELAALVRADQAGCWRRGERPRAEDYLGLYPALAGDAEAALEVIYGELLLREQYGESPPLEECLRRFPQHEVALRRRLTLHRALAGASRAPAGRPGSGGPPGGAPARIPTPRGLPVPLPVTRGTHAGDHSPTPHSFLARAGQRGQPPAEGRSQPEGSQTIGRFRVQKLLGEGGFARVYLAYDPALERQVAIKVPRESDRGSDFLRREAVVAGRLKHPGIVQIYEICPNSSFSPHPGDPSAYVVMQYVEGTNLAKKLEADKVSLDYAVDLLLDVAETLAFAHDQGVLHRDLKPHNILLDVNDRPYVGDFGLAIRQETLDHHLGEAWGTPAYMSPEQAAGASLTPASDIWSLGVILYELLVRQRPFGSHPPEILKRLGKEDPVPPRQHDSAISPDLERVCLKCLARNPADRYQSARDLVADLRRWKTHRAVGPGEDDLRKADQYYKQAFSGIDGGELAPAIERLQAVVRLNPDAANGYYLLGLSYLMTDQSVELAVGPPRRAVELNRGNDAANFLLANVYYEVKAFHLAAPFADQALATKPSNQGYRDFLRSVREALEAVAPGEVLESREIKYELEPPRRRQLSEVAEALFHLEKTRHLSLTHWTELHYPWRLIRYRPLLGATLTAVGLYGTVLAVLLWWGSQKTAGQLVVISVLVWIGLYVPFLLARLLEKTYVRLLPAINMPEDAFRRFFVRQSAYVLGGSCGIGDAEKGGRFRLSWQHNRPHLLIAAASLPILFALQCACANERFWPLTPDRVALYATAFFQVYALAWIMPLALLCVFFLPRFYNVPVRYFLGMPPELSLGAVGTLYVRLSWLGCVGYLLFLLQHYLFRTFRTAPLLSGLYLAIGVCWIVAIVIVTQYQLYRLLGRLKARKVLEYSYHLESSFERVMKEPSEKGFEELAAHRQFMKGLRQLNTRGLTREDLLAFLLILAIVLGATWAYGYLVANDLWLL
jgi:tetratricopeptide (TPR) repeat protein